MRIRVKCFFSIKEAMDNLDELWLDLGQASIRDVVQWLTDRFGTLCLDLPLGLEADHELPGVQILLNGRHYRHLPLGLDTILADGDFVAIFPAVAGG